MTAHTGPVRRTPLRSIAIIGKGRLGTSLAQALRTNPNGFRLHSFIAGRDPNFHQLIKSGGPEVLVIATRDSDIQTVARQAMKASPKETWSNLKLIVHLAGSQPSTILPERSGVARLTLHPIQTFPKPNGALFKGISFAAASQDRAAINWAKQFVKALDGKDILQLTDASLPLYHAMIVLGANFITLLEAIVEDLSVVLGINPKQMKLRMAPLMRASLENALNKPALDALTGPIKRGDVTTIRAHREALRRLGNKEGAPEIRAIYAAFVHYASKKL